MLLVVAFHFQLVPGAKSGFLGVDLFFVVSGFLITTIVRAEVEARRFSIARFWLRRLRRLAPALFAVLALVLLYGALRLLPGEFRQLAVEALATQLYVANVHFWRSINYFGIQAGDAYLLHTWSLAVEEQFYLLYPLALVAALKIGRRFALLAVLAAALLSFGLNIVFVGARPEATFYLMPTRGWELLAGALLTWAPPLRRAWISNLAALAGMALIATAVLAYHEGLPFPGWFALLPVAGAACLIHAGGQQTAVVVRALGAPPLAYLGRLSYSLYLVHWPVSVFAARELGAAYSPAWRLATALLCVALSALLFHFVEAPMRRGRHARKQRTFIIAYAVGVAASVGLCAAVIATDGLPGRLHPAAVALAAYADDRPRLDCQYPQKGAATPAPLCMLGAAGSSPEWLVWGDSHAWAARDAIDDWLKRSGSAGRFTFLASCVPVKGVDVFMRGPACRAMNAELIALAASDPAIRKVFLVSTWRQAKEGLLTASLQQKLDPAQSIELFQRQFAATVAELSALGKEVYIWEPVPGARGHVPNGLARAALNGRAAELDVTLAEYRADNAFFFAALDKSRAQVRASFSPSAALCAEGTCKTVMAGRPIYFDNSHLAQSMHGFWAAALDAQIGSAAGRSSRSP